VGLFSGFSKALSSIGKAVGGLGSEIVSQVESGVQSIGTAAIQLAPLAQFIPGPIGLGALAVQQIGGFFGDAGQPISVAGFAATQNRQAFGPQARAQISSQPAPVLPQRSRFGFGFGGVGGGGGFSAPFAAQTFQGFGGGAARSSQAFGGFQRFQPRVALGAPTFSFAAPSLQRFSFTGFRPSLAGFSFLGR